MKKSRFAEQQVAFALKQVELGIGIVERGRSAAIKIDNGSKLAGKVLDRWAYEEGV